MHRDRVTQESHLSCPRNIATGRSLRIEDPLNRRQRERDQSVLKPDDMKPRKMRLLVSFGTLESTVDQPVRHQENDSTVDRHGCLYVPLDLVHVHPPLLGHQHSDESCYERCTHDARQAFSFVERFELRSSPLFEARASLSVVISLDGLTDLIFGTFFILNINLYFNSLATMPCQSRECSAADQSVCQQYLTHPSPTFQLWNTALHCRQPTQTSRCKCSESTWFLLTSNCPDLASLMTGA